MTKLSGMFPPKCDNILQKKFKKNFFYFLFERDVPMTPYNHLRSQDCNDSWRVQFMYIAQLAPHTTFNT